MFWGNIHNKYDIFPQNINLLLDFNNAPFPPEYYGIPGSKYCRSLPLTIITVTFLYNYCIPVELA